MNMELTSIPNSAGQADAHEHAPRQPIKLAHITDAHASDLAGIALPSLLGKRTLGYLSWRRKRRHQHSLAVLESITEELLKHQPDLIVITGDLIHIGLHTEMLQLRAWLTQLNDRSQVLLVPGNHDLYREDSHASYAAAWGDLPLFGAAVGPTWPRVIDFAGVRVIGLCSAYAAPWQKADGRLGEQQLADLERTLEQAGARHTVVALHHPVTQQGVSKRKALVDADALTALLKKHAVSAVLHGHLHDNLEYRIGETLCLCTAPASSTYTENYAENQAATKTSGSLTSGTPGRPHRPLPAMFRTLEFAGRESPPVTALHTLSERSSFA